VTGSNIRPRPEPDTLSAPFWLGCLGGVLLVQRCSACSRSQFPPLRRCTSCLSEEVEWVAVTGQGSIISWTQIRRPVASQFAELVPLTVCLVELADGVRMVGNLVPEPGHSVDHVDLVGLHVKVVFDEVQDGFTLPAWTLVDVASTE